MILSDRAFEISMFLGVRHRKREIGERERVRADRCREKFLMSVREVVDLVFLAHCDPIKNAQHTTVRRGKKKNINKFVRK